MVSGYKKETCWGDPKYSSKKSRGVLKNSEKHFIQSELNRSLPETSRE